MDKSPKSLAQLLAEQHHDTQRVKNQTRKIARHTRIRARLKGAVASRHKDIRTARKAGMSARGAAAAVKWALAQAGTVETPYGSNRGPKVSAWQKVFGIDGSPWCGAFVGNALKTAGVAVTSRIVYVPYIVADGKTGTNGMSKIVQLTDAKLGDLICYDWNGDGVYDHVGMFRQNYTGGLLHTIEGNTSADDGGSQSNGGGVFLRDRATSQARGIVVVRPRYMR